MEPASVKLGPWIESESAVVAVNVPDCPVTVMVLAPGVAVLLTVNVSVLEPVVETGENAAVTPAGRPAMDRLTPPVNPYAGRTVIVEVPEAPWLIPTAAGPADKVKTGVCTATVTLVLAVKVPEVPVIVTIWLPAGAEVVADSVMV